MIIRGVHGEAVIDVEAHNAEFRQRTGGGPPGKGVRGNLVNLGHPYGGCLGGKKKIVCQQQKRLSRVVRWLWGRGFCRASCLCPRRARRARRKKEVCASRTRIAC